MKKRIHLKKKLLLSKGKKYTLIIYVLIILIISIILLFRYMNKFISPILLDYAEVESKKIATIIVSKAITNEMASKMTNDNLFIVTKASNGEIQTIDFNSVLVNELLLEATTLVQNNLQYLQNGQIDKLKIGENSLSMYDKDNLKNGIFYSIPLGIIFNNTLLANLGPKIPVRFSLVGDITANLVSNVKSYGINSALIEVQICLQINQKVILPVATRNAKVEVSVPVALKIIQGVVPNYYLNGFSNNSGTFTLPIE